MQRNSNHSLKNSQPQSRMRRVNTNLLFYELVLNPTCLLQFPYNLKHVMKSLLYAKHQADSEIQKRGTQGSPPDMFLSRAGVSQLRSRLFRVLP